MADDTNSDNQDGSATGTDQQDDGSDQQGGQSPPEEQGLPDGAKKALAAARREAREAEKARKALAAEVEQYKQRDLTDQQKLEKRATDAETVAESATRDLNRLRAALDAGLEAADADLVTGSTPAEMKASAARLAERFGGSAPNFDGGARTPPGATPSMNDLIRRARARQ
jgi:molecular chaperone GrpE (heat shock protein)